ncbi:hypothetical protein BTH55_03010 [Lactobacillus delbrueckii subsp. bulgaricus]|nr:hypothetical protein [Lactobacillus delbrueckii subsp. bulgaricus]MBT8856859.1 hypothetical protein [Lactobacillus delbrueckii subsp. bulgaricus]MBT8866582.1 hypothetical protein [Lactobacillus delbrueckii subsp. bulgaricus]
MNDKILFEKDKPSNKIWHVEHVTVPKGGGPAVRDTGRLEISFDKKKIYNLWTDYPDKFTPEEIEIFKKEEPYWANFFKAREKH